MCLSQRLLSPTLTLSLQHGKYTVKSRTMLFMPHCGVELYENILRENWNADALKRILLLGNVLQEYETG